MVVEERYRIDVAEVMKNEIGVSSRCEISVITGDAYRHKSIYNGVKALKSGFCYSSVLLVKYIYISLNYDLRRTYD